MWWTDKGKWKFRCRVVWDEFVKLSTGDDADPQVEAWVDNLKQEYGEDHDQWPEVGCGARFRPWTNGPLRVVEMRQSDGQWKAFMADRMPTALDDAIKGRHWEMAKALGQMSSRDLWESVPMIFPMTNHPPVFPMLSRFPVEEWKRAGAPYLSTKGWCKFCIRL